MKKIALLSNITVDLLAGMLGKTMDVYHPAGFDSWQQEIYMEQSGLYGFHPEIVAILLYAGSYTEVWNDRKAGEQVIDEWMRSVRVLTDRMPGIPVLMSDIDIHSVCCHYGAEKRLEACFEQYLTGSIENLHEEGACVYVLPVKNAVAETGRRSFYSAKMWYMGSMPYSMKGISVLADLILCYSAAVKGARKKCMAVDLDNTLWGGVIGEDGTEGIVLADNKEGARYKDTQRILKKMEQQGVMLAILSKNNPEDVDSVMSHPDMVLGHEDFVAEAVNWRSKAENIKDMAEVLNIGLDAFVFLDDNPAEREQMRAVCPEVAVLDFPNDSSLLPAAVEKAYYDYFFSLEVSGEDRGKTDMYRSEAKRKAEYRTAASVDDYLKNLEMSIIIHDMKPEEEKRVTQLVNKTNQFNLTTIRYSEAEIHEMAGRGDWEIITAHMSDKYGSQGLAAVVILKYSGDTALIDTFLMSCRVMGRQAEDVLLEAVRTRAAGRGAVRLAGTYIKTAKNSPVEDFYDRSGFTETGRSGPEGGIGFCRDYVAETGKGTDACSVFKTVSMFED